MSKAATFLGEVGTLPLRNDGPMVVKRRHLRHALLGLGAILLTGTFFIFTSQSVPPTNVAPRTEHLLPALDLSSFHSNVHFHDDSDDLCPGMFGNATSHSGYIGLRDDSPDSPRRSFFW